MQEHSKFMVVSGETIERMSFSGNAKVKEINPCSLNALPLGGTTFWDPPVPNMNWTNSHICSAVVQVQDLLSRSLGAKGLCPGNGEI